MKLLPVFLLLFLFLPPSVSAQSITPVPTCRYACSSQSCGICTVAAPNSCTSRGQYCCPPLQICDPRAVTPTPVTCVSLGGFCSPTYCNTGCDLPSGHLQCGQGRLCCRSGCVGTTPTSGPVPTLGDCISPNSADACTTSTHPVRCSPAWLCCRTAALCPVWPTTPPISGAFPTVQPVPTSPPPYCDPADPESGISTAFGCLPVQTRNLVNTVLAWSAGVSGGIAFLVAAYAVFLLITSAGDPKKIAAGRELFTAAVSGLVIIILAVVLLNFLGFTLLNLPSFVGNPNL